MKHQWKMLALVGALVIAGCTDSPGTPTTPALESGRVPAAIAVPKIRGSEAGTFEFNADGTRHLVLSEDPIAGGNNCYDVCDSSGGSTDPAASSDPEAAAAALSILISYTEAHFERDIFKGHTEMTYVGADHASQEMSLTTARQDGSTLGSAKFSSSKIWPVPQLAAQGLVTDGSMFAPQCDGRGTAVTQHNISISAMSRTYGVGGPSQSGMMYQAKCQQVTDGAAGGTQASDATVGYTPTGGLRICQRLDHYSSSGEYIYTETLYCYDTYNAT